MVLWTISGFPVASKQGNLFKLNEIKIGFGVVYLPDLHPEHHDTCILAQIDSQSEVPSLSAAQTGPWDPTDLMIVSPEIPSDYLECHLNVEKMPKEDK